ncbi:hypothetical protein [Asticcacaulis benevestitus]|uniref:Uncharacterized protein n=1 Tax=Asticcacaulis benevestitus DSM 16100 = ATCC BAA-896 TaxID=1121022 RepID=V4PRM2_9CAUL|nr:hypothetical protein [Asticcacaulis benevestitus]ESQ90961.1 hypothetical protein ABENE_10955 [Asticcacaulis benevestitus DSM 16100 = ATCC BAA-896]
MISVDAPLLQGYHHGYARGAAPMSTREARSDNNARVSVVSVAGPKMYAVFDLGVAALKPAPA